MGPQAQAAWPAWASAAGVYNNMLGATISIDALDLIFGNEADVDEFDDCYGCD